MSQPQITDLFGANSTWNATSKTLEIPLTSLPALTSNQSPTPLELYAAIVNSAHAWLNTNQDTSVMATSDLTNQAPLTRNGTPKTQYQYAVRFFGSYSAPTFNPNDL